MPDELNEVVLQGKLKEEPEQCHNVYGVKNLKKFYLQTERDSGIQDNVLVLYGDKTEIVNNGGLKRIREKVEEKISACDWIEISGKLQTWRNKENGHVQMFVMAQYINLDPKDDLGQQFINNAFIEGKIVKDPELRTTPKGKTITDLTIEIDSIFSKGFKAYIPCIAWGENAKRIAELNEGDLIDGMGRIQERKYIKKTEEKSEERVVWEVSLYHWKRK